MAIFFASFEGHTQSLSPTIAPHKTVPPPTPYQITEKSAGHRVWERTNYEARADGSVIPHVHRYTELAAGLYYQDQTGVWVESREEIEPYAHGAIARQGQYQVIFAGNLNTASAIDQQTPDGKRLRSNILGLAYHDQSSGQSVIIAQIQDSQGELISSNQVLYPNAFAGVKADVRYTYKRGGFEQDVILREQLPAPASLGLVSSNTEIEVLTEFVDPPTAKVISHQLNHSSLSDDDISWGRMQLGHGRAFDLGAAAQHHSKIRVRRQYITAAGRTILIEGVPFPEIQSYLSSLPAQASARNRLPVFAAKDLPLPQAPSPRAQLIPMKLALNQASGQGFVLDYQELDVDQTDLTFQSGETYYVTQDVGLWGTTTFEGGSVIKFDEQNGGFAVYSAINNQSDPANPTVFTSMNDDSVGEIIPGSSGEPGQDMVDPMDIFTKNVELDNLRFYNNEVTVYNWIDGSTNIFWNCEFFNCNETIDLTYGKVILRNVLNCAVNFYGSDMGANLSDCWFSVDAQNVTDNGQQPYVVDGGTFVGYPDGAENVTLLATNCILIGATNDLALLAGMNGHYGYVYRVKDIATNATFQTAGNDDYYLAASSPWHGAGTPHIDAGLLTEFQTMTTYAPQAGGWPDTNGTALGYHYPVNESSANDGVPDWWKWDYFGTFSISAANLDGNGNTFLFDYQNGLDPNFINFYLSITNEYFNHTSAPVRLDIVGGWPSYVAVVLDDTNYITDASWQTFNGTNLTVNLGSTQGWHTVYIGLRGLPSEAVQTWRIRRLKLDLNPPLLVITNPTFSTISIPLIQLQGYSPEALGRIVYDITNATGLITNLPVLVTGQFYGTNTFEFTTNAFAAVDVFLTNGLNTITFHATDLAGNVTVTNFNITLDYSSRTNPPVVNLFWPQNGTLVCNSSYTWRGWVNDPASTVTAQLVDTSGNTNVFDAIVERNGDFWVENIPETGTNYLTLTVTDSAGNVAMTNITVYPGAVSLTIDTPASDQLWSPVLTVTGTMGDFANYSVWVNGAKATSNGDGTWTATNVFLPPGGTALIQARAIPNSDNSGNGTGGSGGGPVACADLGNPDPPQDNDDELQTDRPIRLYMKTYADSDTGESVSEYFYTGGNWAKADRTGTLSGSWQDYGGGASSWNWLGVDTSNNGNLTQTDWVDATFAASLWPDIEETIVNASQDDLDSGFDPNMEHCDIGEPVIDISGSYSCPEYLQTEKDTENRHAQATMILQTGGKAQSGRQNLFVINASAAQILCVKAPIPLWQNPPPPSPPPILPQQICVDGQCLDANGNAYLILPDNSEIDVTPQVDGIDFYTFGITAQKYKSYFSVYVAQPDPTGTWVPNPDDPSGTTGTTVYLPWLPGVGPGHAWWCVTTEAPADAVTKLNQSSVNLEYLGAQVGYGPKGGVSLWNSTTKSFLTAPGQFPYPYGGSPTTNAIYSIDFKSIFDGLSYEEALKAAPGNYSVANPANTCVTKTRECGAAVGITLPGDASPEFFGFDLPPSDP